MNRREKVGGTGLGVGYVTVMMIFAVICMTIFAVLSYSAASSDSAFNKRGGEYLKQYYAADSTAKEKLAMLDAIAKSAADSGFFEDFESAAAEVSGVKVSRVRDGFSANWTVKINDRQELAATVEFTADGGCEITNWQSRTISQDDSGEHLNVWDGSF
ncbi:MAG: hypothetical protein K2N38_14505 [Oscillospiraceae bacterium]|nr:hypothetical protein [Oscillospiraceae bacterium]